MVGTFLDMQLDARVALPRLIDGSRSSRAPIAPLGRGPHGDSGVPCCVRLRLLDGDINRALDDLAMRRESRSFECLGARRGCLGTYRGDDRARVRIVGSRRGRLAQHYRTE